MSYQLLVDPANLTEYSTYRVLDIAGEGGRQQMLGPDGTWFGISAATGWERCTSARIRLPDGSWMYISDQGPYTMRIKMEDASEENGNKSLWVDLGKVSTTDPTWPYDPYRYFAGYGPEGAMVTNTNGLVFPIGEDPLWYLDNFQYASGYYYDAPGMYYNQDYGVTPTCFRANPLTSRGQLTWNFGKIPEMVQAWSYFAEISFNLDSYYCNTPVDIPLIQYVYDVAGVQTPLFTVWLSSDPGNSLYWYDVDGTKIQSYYFLPMYSDNANSTRITTTLWHYGDLGIIAEVDAQPTNVYDLPPVWDVLNTATVIQYPSSNPAGSYGQSVPTWDLPYITELTVGEFSNAGTDLRLTDLTGWADQGWVYG